MNAATALSPPSAAAGWGFPNRATPPGSAAYYGARFAPTDLRDAVAVLFGWRGEVRRILDDVSDPGVARLKLDWWRDEIQRSMDGRPRHPLSKLLAPVLMTHALPLKPFLDQARQVENDLHTRRSADQAAQHRALMDDRGALFELVCRCHGTDEPARLAAARHAGAWCEQVRRIRDGGLLLRRAREVVPEDGLVAAGLQHEQLCARTTRHRLPGLLAPVGNTLIAEAPNSADECGLPRALRIQIAIHTSLLNELARADFDVVDQRISLTPLRKLWIAWRTGR
ncbi:MAG: squalene/phytoene synthase family protein [Thiohalocapsa sp.]